jgi:hypothetical protein
MFPTALPLNIWKTSYERTCRDLGKHNECPQSGAAVPFRSCVRQQTEAGPRDLRREIRTGLVLVLLAVPIDGYQDCRESVGVMDGRAEHVGSIAPCSSPSFLSHGDPQPGKAKDSRQWLAAARCGDVMLSLNREFSDLPIMGIRVEARAIDQAPAGV